MSKFDDGIAVCVSFRSDGVPHPQKVVPSLDEAISYVTTPPVGDQIEKVFVMGGGRNFNVRSLLAGAEGSLYGVGGWRGGVGVGFPCLQGFG